VQDHSQELKEDYARLVARVVELEGELRREKQLFEMERATHRFDLARMAEVETELASSDVVFKAQATSLKAYHALVIAADRAIGDHNAPNDCYATGPLTGDPIADLVECPACIYLAMREKAPIPQPKG
jgi:hypothetical protein